VFDSEKGVTTSVKYITNNATENKNPSLSHCLDRNSQKQTIEGLKTNNGCLKINKQYLRDLTEKKEKRRDEKRDLGNGTNEKNPQIPHHTANDKISQNKIMKTRSEKNNAAENSVGAITEFLEQRGLPSQWVNQKRDRDKISQLLDAGATLTDFQMAMETALSIKGHFEFGAAYICSIVHSNMRKHLSSNSVDVDIEQTMEYITNIPPDIMGELDEGEDE